MYAADSSGGGRCHNSALWEGAEEGAGQGHHHRGGLDDNSEDPALPDTGLIAAVGWWCLSAGSAQQPWQALIIVRHVSELEVHLGERAGERRAWGWERSSLSSHSERSKVPAD